MKYKQMNDYELSCELLRVRTLLRTNPNPHTYHQNKKYLEKLEKEYRKRNEKKDN